MSSAEFEIDHRGDDSTYVLVRPYQIENNEEVGKQLFEHIMLVQRAKDFGLQEMGHFKHSHSALDKLEAC